MGVGGSSSPQLLNDRKVYNLETEGMVHICDIYGGPEVHARLTVLV